jgi:hypothetical protein
MITPLARIRALPERLRRRFYPRWATFALNCATASARRVLQSSERLGVLVDNTILDIAVTHESRWIHTKTGGYLARVPVHSPGNKSDRYRQSTYLTGIAHLARLGELELFLSAELNDEQFRQPIGRFKGYGYFDYSLFSDLKLKPVDGWVFPAMGPPSMDLPSVEEQQRERLAHSDDQLFHDLYALLQQQLGKKCDQDAWHIRTAERHSLFCFLTTDTNLLKACNSLAKKEPLRSMNTQIMTPRELAAYLGIEPVAPILLSYHDADCFVRVDHTMEGERRRKRSEYK